jgi:hypothetical protein
VKKLLAMPVFMAVPVFVAVIGLLCSGAGPAAASTAAGCTAANGQICTFGHWDIYNNTWGPTPGKYVVHAHSHGRWSVTAKQNGGGGCGGCAVETYESAQWNYAGGVRYSSIKFLYSSFSETMPTGSLRRNGVDAEAAYDIFLKGSDTDEVMVWVDNQGQTPAGSLYKVAKIHHQEFGVYVSGGTKSFVLRKNETHGTINYLAILRWLHRHGMLASSDALTQFNFGWEICDTGGVARTFTVHNLTLHQKF